jgi:hypothetical protein
LKSGASARERGDHKGLIAMGRIVELPSIKPRSTSRRQDLRKLSPDLISKARDETATQVTRIGLTFVVFWFYAAGASGPDRAQSLPADLYRARRQAGSTCKVSAGSAGANLGPAPERTDAALQWLDLLSVAASGNAALCMESCRVSRLGILSVRRRGSDHRQPCHVAVQ